MTMKEELQTLPTFNKFKLPGYGLPLDFKPARGHDPLLEPVSNPAQGEGRKLFPTVLETQNGYYLDASNLPILTIRERNMLSFMNEITDKPNWHKKIFNKETVAKWRHEASFFGDTNDFTEAMLDWCIDELRYRVKSFQKTGAISVFTADVVKSDGIVPEEVNHALRIAVARLEDVPEDRKDWHPGSNGQVLDLVHPSLFPLVYGRSRILKDRLTTLENCIKLCGLDETIPVPDSNATPIDPDAEELTKSLSNSYSRTFQWLPCDVDISDDNAKITSYINNLHPHHHSDLYVIIEKIINQVIPLWNMTLTPLKSPKARYTRISVIKASREPPEVYESESEDDENGNYDDLEQEYTEEIDETGQFVYTHYSIGEASPGDDQEGETNDGNEDSEEMPPLTKYIYPDVKDFFPPLIVGQPFPSIYTDPEDGNLTHYEPDWGNGEYIVSKFGSWPPSDYENRHWELNLRKEYGRRGLQVIVKLVNIHLTPDNPRYKGGTWHIEGQLNEHICATAVYYYDCENITTGELVFRQHVSSSHINEGGISYEQNDEDWLMEFFGLPADGCATQDLGSIAIREGRLITFPNILQHRVRPFRLEDPTKPGHRKILVLFLVDPNIRVISTANIPCQQFDWWRVGTLTYSGGEQEKERNEQGEKSQKNRAIPTFPAELLDMIYDQVQDFPFTMEEAKKLRLELMEERKCFALRQNDSFLAERFSLCEH